MMGFIFLAFALLAFVIWLIAPVLFGRQIANFDSNEQLNINIARERLADLETQLSNAEIDQSQYDLIKNEIESSLLDDTDENKTTHLNPELPAQYKRIVFILLTIIPFSAFGLYQYWGSPDAINMASTNRTDQASSDAANPHADQNKHAAGLDEAIVKLEARLKQDPNNPDGWYMLARSYSVQKQYAKSVDAYRKLYALVGEQPAVMLGLADTLTMSRNGDISGEPFELAKRALKLEPTNTTALWLAGIGYQDAGDIPKALELWKLLLSLLGDDPRSSQEVKTLISNAERQLNSTPGQASANTAIPSDQAAETKLSPTEINPSEIKPAKLTVKVQIDTSLRSTVSDTDYVMIYAQRVSGMKMPLAIVKAQVKDMPTTVTLDDSLSIGPMGKLSDAKEVNVLARISQSGQAIKQSGDIEAKTGPYPVSHADPIEIIIKQPAQ